MGYTSRRKIYRRSNDAFNAGRNAIAERQMARLPKFGQQNLHILGAKPIQNEPKEDIHWPHGVRLCVQLRLFARYELFGVGRWRWQSVHLGLENNETV